MALLGCGGVSRTFACEAALAGCAVVDAVRDPLSPRALQLREDVERLVPGASFELVSMGGLSGDFDLLINGTPVGMTPHPEGCPVGREVLSRTAAVFDAIYNPARTRLLQLAEAEGARTLGGMPMLVWQAVQAHTCWYGASFRQEDIEALCQEAEEELARRFGGPGGGTLMEQGRNIILCGFMGCGKTTVGKRVAARTGRRFVDMDEFITQQAGMSVSEIFARLGEADFRRREREACRELAGERDCVIGHRRWRTDLPGKCGSLAGSGPYRAAGCGAEVLLLRLAGDKTRPLLARAGPGGKILVSVPDPVAPLPPGGVGTGFHRAGGIPRSGSGAGADGIKGSRPGRTRQKSDGTQTKFLSKNG